MATATPDYPGLGRRIEGGKFQAPGIERPGGYVPEIKALPELADLLNLSNADLNEVLKQHGVMEPWPSLIAEAQKYNARFSNLSPLTDRAEFDAQVRALLDLEPREDGRPSRGMLGLARRVQERYTTMEAMDGNPGTVLARVAEIDDASCAGCLALADFEGTYAEHQAKGLPGQQECGSNCRCQLIRIEYE